MSVTLEDLKKKKRRIGVATGQSKVECICGAIRGGIINIHNYRMKRRQGMS